VIWVIQEGGPDRVLNIFLCVKYIEMPKKKHKMTKRRQEGGWEWLDSLKAAGTKKLDHAKQRVENGKKSIKQSYRNQEERATSQAPRVDQLAQPPQPLQQPPQPPQPLQQTSQQTAQADPESKMGEIASVATIAIESIANLKDNPEDNLKGGIMSKLKFRRSGGGGKKKKRKSSKKKKSKKRKQSKTKKYLRSSKIKKTRSHQKTKKGSF